MHHHFVAILEAAGVNVTPPPLTTTTTADADDEDHHRIVRVAMEEWLGILLQQSSNSTTVEDSLPLSPHVYQCTVQWLVEAWNTTTIVSSHADDDNDDQQKKKKDVVVTTTTTPYNNILERWFPSVQAMRYLCFWMDCNLKEQKGEEEEEQEDTGVFLLRQLLLHQRTTETTNNNNNPLLRALYRHVESLPLLLQHVHSMTRKFVVVHTTTTTTTTPANKEQQRARQYAQSQAFRHHCQDQWDAHMERLTVVLQTMYQASDPVQRQRTRRFLGHVWQSVVYQSRLHTSSTRENTQAVAVRPTLRLLRRILLGSSAAAGGAVSEPHRTVLLTTLVDLHTPNGVVLWRDQAPVLELYHEILCQCIGLVLQQDAALVEPFLTRIANMLLLRTTRTTTQGGQQQHSGKQVLLLHEIETFLPFLPPSSSSFVIHVLVPLLAQSIASDHFRVAEQALQFFRRNNDSTNNNNNILFTPAVLQHEGLWKALVRRTPSWNPTVRKQTAHVLELFQETDPALFRDMANRLFSSSSSSASQGRKKTATPPKVTPQQQPTPPQQLNSSAPMTTTASAIPLPHSKRSLTTLPRTMAAPAAAPPPPRPSSLPQARWSRASGLPPPLTVTGVAPWAQQQQQPPRRRCPPLQQQQQQQPPSRGVAPWAQQQPQPPSPATVQEAPTNSSDEPTMVTGYDFVLQHMRQLKPKPSPTSAASNIMSETPTFLPTLQFHDLVFGHELGRGSFGTVQYAKHILKQQPLRSLWPEYAVKIVPQHNINRSFRELATLSLVSHPGVTRLVSYFAFRTNGVYMVLEYASGGDLQTLLQQQGSLDVDATRSVMGQVLAALDYMHDNNNDAVDLVYGDLKPENIVVTDSHHVKLTDFGACRGATAAARERVDALARQLQANVRDGDWKITGKRSLTKNGFVPHVENGDEQSASDLPTNVAQQQQEEELDLEKVEGTTAYLPPEVVLGEIPTKEADCWAFGCVLYQCLTGRPPLLEADEATTKNRIVHFDSSAEDISTDLSSTSATLFSGGHAKSIDADSRSLILALLDRDRSKRPGMKQVASHAFFSSVNVFALYKEPATPLGSGSVGPAPNAQWARRQFSSIWAPQPKAYNLLSASSTNNRVMMTANDDIPIEEGPERDGYYTVATSSSAAAVTLDGRRARSGNMLPPPHRVIVEE